MSYRRAISFNTNEKDLVDYFDNNGKSDIGKTALKFYRENKDKIMVGNVKELINMITEKDKPQQQVKGINGLLK